MSNPHVSQLDKRVHDDTEDDVESKQRNDDKERHVEKHYSDSLLKIVRHVCFELLKITRCFKTLNEL